MIPGGLPLDCGDRTLNVHIDLICVAPESRSPTKENAIATALAPARGSNPRDGMRADVASVLVAKPASGLSPEAPDRAPVGGADVVVVVL